MPHASAIAEAHRHLVSDIVLLDASHRSATPAGLRAHFISSDWSTLFAMAALPRVLRDIRIELIDASVAGVADDPDLRGQATAPRQCAAAASPGEAAM